MLFCFRDPGAERAFRLHYAGSGTRHALGATVGVLLLLLQLAMAAVGHSAAPAIEVLLKLAWVAEFYVWYVPLGKEQFILCLGPYTVWKRLLATCYFWQLAKVVGPSLPVQKHLLILHCAFGLARPVSLWYWGGSVLCWLAVVLIDSMGGGAGGAGVLQRMPQAAAGSGSLSFFLYMLVPGLVLSCFELRARRVWLAQQQPAEQLHAAAAAAPESPCLAKQAEGQLPGDEAELVKPACCASSSSSSSQSAAGRATAGADPRPPMRGLVPAGAAATGGNAVPAAAGSYVAGAVGAAPAAQQQGMLPTRLLYRSPVSRRTVSFKFTQAPELDSAERFQVKLAEALQAAAMAALTSRSSHQQPAAVVAADVAAFPGCWQLILQLVLPAGQEALLQPRLLQQAAEQVLGSWPECSLQGMQLLLCQSAAVGGSGHLGSTAARAAAESPYLDPVVLTLPDSISGSSSSSGSSNSIPAGAATATLCIPAAHVQQLISAGWRSVRVVVMPGQLPAGQLLLDSTWQLPAATAAADLALDTSSGGGGSDTFAPTAPATAHADTALSLQLSLPAGPAEALPVAPVTAAARVLSVTVLAGGGAGPASSKATATAAAAAAAAGVSPAFPDPAPSTHGAAHHVLAKLPLLVLPSAAAGEFQQLYTELMAQGASRGAAYRQLLPLLQDLAGVLVHAAAAASVHPSSAEPAYHSSGSSCSSSSLMNEVVSELAAYFTSHGMAACLQLLPDVTAPQPAEAADSRPEMAVARAAAVDLAAAAPAATCTVGCVSGFTGASPGLPEQPIVAGNAAAAAAALDTLVSQPGGPFDGGAASSDSRAGADVAMGPAGSMKAAADASASSSGRGVNEQQVKSGGSSSRSAFTGTKKDSPPASEAPPARQQSFQFGAYPASALHISGWTLLFGFQEATVEAAYRWYETSMLPVQSLWLSLFAYAATACVCMVQVVQVLARSSSSAGMPEYRLQVYAAVLRLLYAATCTAAHAVVWAAGVLRQSPRQPRWLCAVRQHSAAVLSVGMLLPVAALVIDALTGGVWAAAYAATNAAFLDPPWVLCVYRHVAEPLVIRAGVIMTACSVAVLLLLFDPLFTRPQLLGLGPNVTALLLCGVHLGVAAWLELGMRRSFVRRAGRAREA